jgi:hypothetical protein
MDTLFFLQVINLKECISSRGGVEICCCSGYFEYNIGFRFLQWWLELSVKSGVQRLFSVFLTHPQLLASSAYLCHRALSAFLLLPTAPGDSVQGSCWGGRGWVGIFSSQTQFCTGPMILSLRTGAWLVFMPLQSISEICIIHYSSISFSQ